MSTDDDDLVQDYSELIATGEATDSGEGELAHAKLPRLLRLLLAAGQQRPALRERLLAEVASLAPDLSEPATVWAVSAADHDGQVLAGLLDAAAVRQDLPELRTMADAARLLSLPIDASHRVEHRRVALALITAAEDLPKEVPPELRAAIDKATIGWLSIAAGAIPRSRMRFTHAADLAIVLGRERTTRIVLAAAAEEELHWKARKADADRIQFATSKAVEKQQLSEVPDGFIRICDPASRPGPLTDILRRYQRVLAEPVALVRTPDLARVRAVLLAEFPHCEQLLDRILGEIAGRSTIHLRPMLLVGPPGSGKTRLARRLAEELGLGVWRTDAASADGAAFGGTAQRWSTSEPSHGILAILKSRQANGTILIDELDKAPTDTRHGRLWDSLLTIVEPESAARWVDPALQVAVDLSHLCVVATANSLAAVPQPLLDRLIVLTMPTPERRHLDALIPSVLRQVGAERGLKPEWIEPLTPDERALVASTWPGGSVRSLRRCLDAILRARDRPFVRH